MQTFCHQVIFNTEVAKKEVQHSQQSLNSVCHTHETKPGRSKVGLAYKQLQLDQNQPTWFLFYYFQ